MSFRPRSNVIDGNKSKTFHALNAPLDCVIVSRNAVGNYASSPLSSRHGSQESLRHLSSMSSMNMLQTPTGTRDIAGAQKKKGIKSSLGRFFSKKEKVSGDAWRLSLSPKLMLQWPFQVKGVKDSMPDGSSSIMSGLSMNMSDIDSNYDTMSISSRMNVSGTSKMDYGRQKKKWERSPSSVGIEKLIDFLPNFTENTIIVTIFSPKRWKLELPLPCGMALRLLHG